MMIRDVLAASIAAVIGLWSAHQAADTTAPPVQAPVAAKAPAKDDDAVRKQAIAAYARMPLAFEANQGQTDARVNFLSRGLGYSLFLTPTEAVFKMGGGTGDKAAPAVLRMGLVGANAAPRVAGEDRQQALSQYLRGNDPAKWQRDIAQFGKVRYDEVYPGVDLVYYGSQNRLEYDFIVAPGADPDTIVMKLSGAGSRHLDADGNLVLATPQGEITQNRPVLYQQIEGRRIAVEGRYKLLADNRVAFEVGRYDRGHALVIDPVIDYSGWIDANYFDYAYGVAVDRAGNAYITGSTQSSDFPVTNGSHLNSSDIYLAKLNAAGNGLLYSSYIGSSSTDQALAIALDAAGNIYLGGDTRGDADDTVPFPLVNAYQTQNTGYDVAWVMKLNPSMSIVYSTLLGGSSFQHVQGIAVDASGQAFVVGTTDSTNFPTKNARQASNATAGGANSGRDTFVAKFGATGSLLFSTYHGGGLDDYGRGIAVDTAGNAYITGSTSSTNFPVLGARQANNAGNWDAFVSKFNPSGALVYSTYHGGSDNDEGYAIAVDRTGAAYITGDTYSDQGATDAVPFPLANAFQSTHGSASQSRDAFVSKFAPAGNALAYSSYLGGDDFDYGYGIAVDAAGNAYVTGETHSTNFPQAARLQAGRGGTGYDYDAFVAKIGVVAGKAKLAFSSYVGDGAEKETGRAIAVDRFGGVYFVGDEQDPANSSLTNVVMAKVGQAYNRTWSGDFDNDGKDDVYWRNLATGGNDLWRSATSTTRIAQAAVTDPNWTVAGVGDFNNDGKSDVLWRNLVTGANDLWLSAQSTTRQAITAATDTNWVVAGVGDFGGDGKSDILWHNRITGASVVWNSGVASTQTALATVSALAWEIVGVGDFNKDGKSDILWRNIETGANQIWRSGNSTTTQAVSSMPVLWRVGPVADYNGDGYADIHWFNPGNYTSQCWLSANGATKLAVAAVPAAWRPVGAGDYNGNGKADLLWRNTQTGQNKGWDGAASTAPINVATVADQAWRNSGL
ncbi:DUF7948 domain-containing protein [Lysobacter fragariae]